MHTLTSSTDLAQFGTRTGHLKWLLHYFWQGGKEASFHFTQAKALRWRLAFMRCSSANNLSPITQCQQGKAHKYWRDTENQHQDQEQSIMFEDFLQIPILTVVHYGSCYLWMSLVPYGHVAIWLWKTQTTQKRFSLISAIQRRRIKRPSRFWSTYKSWRPWCYSLIIISLGNVLPGFILKVCLYYKQLSYFYLLKHKAKALNL